ncbi:hypothetical protein KIN20_036242 [Parelaphostrongylus tenuis]|uniref:arginyltransferase n=1 Tax=Parelaphostrongylus tenuis TaxID=148309 RepID=A0AAD5WL26_PARTN|nr:hypothetical protein KIN20_036242 [Parelaphostrongylus tenuis]
MVSLRCVARRYGKDEFNEDDGDSVSFGVWAHSLSCANYQRFLDHGWRRSGKYIYKPIMDRTCCPQYTIRLDCTKFILSRSQRRTLRYMNDYLRNDTKPRGNVQQQAPVCKANVSSERAIVEEGAGDNNLSARAKDKSDNPVRKKKEMRRERCFARWREKGLDVEEMRKARAEREEARRRTLESYIIEPESSWIHRLEVKLVHTKSTEFEERYNESYLLYRKYQQTIHKDKCTSRGGYNRFLVETPLYDDEEMPRSSGQLRYGSYHQWYILDGKLLAVSVIDILPRCVSSKYMFYDPDFSFLSLGTYTALREIALTRRLLRNSTGLEILLYGLLH